MIVLSIVGIDSFFVCFPHNFCALPSHQKVFVPFADLYLTASTSPSDSKEKPMTGLLFFSEMTQPDASATFGHIFLSSNHFADADFRLFFGIETGLTGSTFFTLLTTFITVPSVLGINPFVPQ